MLDIILSSNIRKERSLEITDVLHTAPCNTPSYYKFVSTKQRAKESHWKLTFNKRGVEGAHYNKRLVSGLN